MNLRDRVISGKTIVRNLKTGKTGVFMGFRKRDDGRLVVRVKFGRVTVYANADNCIMAVKSRDMSGNGRLVAVAKTFAREETCVRDVFCAHYDQCLTAAAKFNDIRVRCDRCGKHKPVDEDECSLLSFTGKESRMGKGRKKKKEVMNGECRKRHQSVADTQ